MVHVEQPLGDAFLKDAEDELLQFLAQSGVPFAVLRFQVAQLGVESDGRYAVGHVQDHALGDVGEPLKMRPSASASASRARASTSSMPRSSSATSMACLFSWW